MLRRLALRDFVIVPALDLEMQGGFSVLTGETGAGKSILIDALQLALGSRGDAGVVREGAARAEISAEFDTPPALAAWLDEAGFDNGDTLLLRRVIDAQGKSRAWVNGSVATVAQLREAADHLVEIHGQHAWQSLTRASSVRELLDSCAGVDPAPLAAAFSGWKKAIDALEQAQSQQANLERERERLAWQIGEVDKLAPEADEWDELNANHQRLSNAQALMDAARSALDAISDADTSADALASRAVDALERVADYDKQLGEIATVLQGAQAQLQDAAHSLNSYLNHTDLDPERLQALDERLSSWISLAKRYRRPPEDMPSALTQWKEELHTLDAATDLHGLQSAVDKAKSSYDTEAKRVSQQRRKAAPELSGAVTQAMQHLGMGGGRFEVELTAQAAPQSFGVESAEFLVAGHAGSTPRPLAKVASGGELSRIALAIAVTTSQLVAGRGATAGTLIFDEIDSGVGGSVADTVGRLMKQLGHGGQVMAVTHLPQVAACADHHYVVSKQSQGGSTRSHIEPVNGEARVAEVARMLGGGERLSGTTLAHAQELLTIAAETIPQSRSTRARKGS